MFWHFFSKISLVVISYKSQPRIVQKTKLVGKGSVSFGKNVMLGIDPSPYVSSGEFYIEVRAEAALVEVGDNVCINNNAVIIADKSSIKIGSDTLIGPNFICFDSDFHPLSPSRRLSTDYSCKPVKIGRNVFIGVNVTILKGVTIGDNSVIGAGCVVSFDVPQDSIVTIDGSAYRVRCLH